MSAYFPPIENVPIFDPVLFSTPNSSDSGILSREEADRLYLQFPNGQGTETLPGLVVSGSATVNTNLFLDGTSGTNYIEFPDNTKQYTAAFNVSQQFQPKFVNYSNAQTGTVGYSSGPLVSFTNSWGRLDYAILRINQQGSYSNSGGDWQYYASTSGTMICRPYFMSAGGWAPLSSNIQYSNNGGSMFGPVLKPLYYSSNVNQGNGNSYFTIGGTDKDIRFYFKNKDSYNGWSTTIEIEYMGRSQSGGNVVFSTGEGTNNSLP